MRASVLMVTVCLGMCSARVEDQVHGVNEENNPQQSMRVEGDQESQRVQQNKREEDKGLKTIDKTETENIELECKKGETSSSSEINQQQINNGMIDKRSSKSENDTEIEGKEDVKGSALNHLHVNQDKGEKGLEDGSNVGDFNLTEEYAESTTAIDSEAHETTKFERRSDDDVTSDKQVNLQNKKERSMRRGGYKIRKVTTVRHSPKMMQRRTFDFWSLLGMGEKKEDVVKITKEVPVLVPYAVEKKVPVPVTVQIERKIPVEVPKPYPVPVEKKVYHVVKEYVQAPYPVYKKVPYLVKVMIKKPVPVHISKPYPIYIEKKVPYAVEKEVPYPVKVLVDRPVPVYIPVVKNVYYPVEKKTPFPVPVTVENPVPVPVEKPYPVYVENKVPGPLETPLSYPEPVEESQQHFGTHDFVNHDITKEEFVPSNQEKPLYYEGHIIQNQFIKEDSFTTLGLNREHHDHSQLRDKKDADDEEEILKSKTEENVEKAQLAFTTEPISTTQFLPEKKDLKREAEETATEEKIDIRDFGKKIRKP